MPGKSNDNIYRPKMTGFLIAAIALILLIAVLLVSTILALSLRPAGDDSTADTTTPSTSTSASTPADPSQTSTTTSTATDPTTSTTPTPDNTGNPTTTPPPTPSGREPVKVTPTETTLPVLKAGVYEGSLLLLDSTHPYQKDPSLLISRSDMGKLSAAQRLEQYGFVAIPQETDTYTTNGSNRFINSEALFYFDEMMDDYVAETGNIDVQVRNAYYYASADDIESIEHATGYYLDLQIYLRDTDKVFPLNYATKKTDYYDWFVANCWKYGFVHVRDTNSYSTFRFVGAAHAAVIHNNGYSISQYLDVLTLYSYNDRLKVTDGFGWEWWIYYVKASGNATTLPVIGDENSYRISGNNTDGYIVAINSSCFA